MSLTDIEELESTDRLALPAGQRYVAASVTQRCLSKRKAAVGYDIPGTQTVFVKTYGCSHNFSDTEYMVGQLVEFGYGITEDFTKADIFLLNSCTVKNPSETHLVNLLGKARGTGKPVVVAGCVPQGDPNNQLWKEVSVIGVQQIDKVAEVIQETLRGNTVRFLARTRHNHPELGLPKIRRNPWIEIVPINMGCLNKCTYCKTKHARGHLISWPVAAICDRIKQVVAEGVREIRLTSEDTGAYGRDIGSDIAMLLNEVVPLLPDGVMLRLGMSNPPYILEHLDAIAEALISPNVYSFIHIPVQSGSNRVLASMAREYTISDFKFVVDTLRAKVPGLTIATDIICGFPGETDADFEETVQLCATYQFAVLNISQFYPRPGTPAALMRQLPSSVIKERSSRLTKLFDTFSPNDKLLNTLQRVWITETASDGFHLAGHTKTYVQVLVPPDQAVLGSAVTCVITGTSRWSVYGRVVDTNYEPSSVPLVSLRRKNALSSDRPKQRTPPERTRWCLVLTLWVVSIVVAAVIRLSLPATS